MDDKKQPIDPKAQTVFKMKDLNKFRLRFLGVTYERMQGQLREYQSTPPEKPPVQDNTQKLNTLMGIRPQDMRIKIPVYKDPPLPKTKPGDEGKVIKAFKPLVEPSQDKSLDRGR